MKERVNIVWFKRDLRINDHKPLLEASNLGLPILPLYVVEPDYWQQNFSSSRHWHFIYDCLLDLNMALTQLALVFWSAHGGIRVPCLPVSSARNLLSGARPRFPSVSETQIAKYDRSGRCVAPASRMTCSCRSLCYFAFCVRFEEEDGGNSEAECEA